MYDYPYLHLPIQMSRKLRFFTPKKYYIKNHKLTVRYNLEKVYSSLVVSFPLDQVYPSFPISDLNAPLNDLKDWWKLPVFLSTGFYHHL